MTDLSARTAHPAEIPAHSSNAADADTLLRELFPICRSITGDGVRRTLARLRQVADFTVHEVPTGTKCLDWTVPDEWNIRDAFIADSAGRRIVDFRASNVHVVSYSEGVDAKLPFAELDSHLHSLPSQPKAIPYRTSYYNRAWGFCLTHEQRERLDRNATYHVKIDATLRPGHLTYGERRLEGSSGKEFLLSTYCCHPSLANDNLSGLVLWALLLKELSARSLRHSYRFVVVPETIGSAVYLAQNAGSVASISGGFVITSVGGRGPLGYKRTFEQDGYLDRIVDHAFRQRGVAPVRYPFEVSGSDERNYSSVPFRIPVGTICKDKYHAYPQYHTSLDDLDFVRGAAIAETLALYLEAIELLEMDATYRTQGPGGEPQLGPRGLYPSIGGGLRTAGSNAGSAADEVVALLTMNFWSDGRLSLLDIAERSGLGMRALADAANKLRGAGLLAVDATGTSP